MQPLLEQNGLNINFLRPSEPLLKQHRLHRDQYLRLTEPQLKQLSSIKFDDDYLIDSNTDKALAVTT